MCEVLIGAPAIAACPGCHAAAIDLAHTLWANYGDIPRSFIRGDRVWMKQDGDNAFVIGIEEAIGTAHIRISEPLPIGFHPKGVDEAKIEAQLAKVEAGFTLAIDTGSQLARRSSYDGIVGASKNLIAGRADLIDARQAARNIGDTICDLLARPWQPPSGEDTTVLVWATSGGVH